MGPHRAHQTTPQAHQTTSLVHQTHLNPQEKTAESAEMKLWWERLPERLEFEEQQLRSLGIDYEIDEAAQKQGRLVIHCKTTLPESDRPIEITAEYPDLYPYFRVHLSTDQLGYEHHQNPFGGNLCLLGRRTSNWIPNGYTLGSMIRDRLPMLVKSNSSNDLPDGIEEPQGEPFSNYYSYSPGSSILIDSDWTIPSDLNMGTLEIATVGGMGQTHYDKGVVSVVNDEHGHPVVNMNEKILRAYCGPRLAATWIRLDKPVPINDADEIVRQKIDGQVFSSATQNSMPLNGSMKILRIFALLFPEEVGYQQKSDGWLFLYSVQTSNPKKGHRPHGHGGRQRR